MKHGKLAQLARQAHQNADKVFRERGDRVDCQSGCHWCCHGPVGITAGELLLLLPRITDAQRERIAQAVQRRAEGASLYRCPFLGQDNTCEVYEARPLTCRGAASSNVNLCRNSSGGMLEWPEGRPVELKILMGKLGAEMKRKIRAWQHVEMLDGLVALMKLPFAERDILRGRNVFAGLETHRHVC